MFEKLSNFFNKMTKPEIKELASKDAAKERLHLVLMQDRANVSVDFLELMKQEIIDVIKKYIVVDENAIDVRLTNQEKDDGTNGAPSLYANIPILNIKNDIKAEKIKDGTLVYENGELERSEVEENRAEVESIKEEKVEVQEVQEETANVEVIELTEPNEDVVENNNEQEQSEPEANEAVVEVVENVVEDVVDSSTIKIQLEAENVEPLVDYEDDEDDEEDVTFDDLLKKAEEEEAIQKSEENENVQDEEKKEAKRITSVKGINQKPIRSNKSTKQKKR